MPAVTKRVYEVLGRRLKFDPKDKEAVGMWDTTEGEKFFAVFFLTFRAFLGVIGSFTLMVGGLGVSNIMYVVVEERTREIGVKLAVGAKPRYIQTQFLLETLTLTAIGGLLGFLITLGDPLRLPLPRPRRVRRNAGRLPAGHRRRPPPSSA